VYTSISSTSTRGRRAAAPARSFSDSVIDLSSMETVPAEHLPSGGDRADDDPAKRVEALRVGDRQRRSVVIARQLHGPDDQRVRPPG